MALTIGIIVGSMREGRVLPQALHRANMEQLLPQLNSRGQALNPIR